jgi:hypothetical protein
VKLFLLAQLNLGQLPALPGFPETGILQFFIAGGDTHGMHLANLASGAGHRVLYHPEAPAAPLVDDGPTGLGAHPDAPDVAAPIAELDLPFEADRPVRLSGQLTTAPLSYTDSGFAARGRELLAADPDSWSPLRPWLAPGGPPATLTDEFDHAFGRGGHTLGGAPFFAGDDPRVMPAYSGHTVLLLQVDSDPAAGLNWGDRGICHFFIEPARLAARDFSRVVYHWDCY